MTDTDTLEKLRTDDRYLSTFTPFYEFKNSLIIKHKT